jgi:hypothetical protein
MTRTLIGAVRLAALCCLVTFGMAPGVFAQPPRLQLDHLNRLASQAREVVDIDLDPAMLEQTSGFLGGTDAQDPKVKAALEGLRSITVKSFEFRGRGAYTKDDVEQIRTQLAAPGWRRFISVRDEDETTEIYFWREGGQNGGLVILAAQPDELTIVSILGRIDLQTLAVMGKVIPKLPGKLK